MLLRSAARSGEGEVGVDHLLLGEPVSMCGLRTPNALTKRVTYGESGQIEYSLLASAQNSRICGWVAMTW